MACAVDTDCPKALICGRTSCQCSAEYGYAYSPAAGDCVAGTPVTDAHMGILWLLVLCGAALWFILIVAWSRRARKARAFRLDAHAVTALNVMFALSFAISGDVCHLVDAYSPAAYTVIAVVNKLTPLDMAAWIFGALALLGTYAGASSLVYAWLDVLQLQQHKSLARHSRHAFASPGAKRVLFLQTLFIVSCVIALFVYIPAVSIISIAYMLVVSFQYFTAIRAARLVRATLLSLGSSSTGSHSSHVVQLMSRLERFSVLVICCFVLLIALSLVAFVSSVDDQAAVKSALPQRLTPLHAWISRVTSVVFLVLQACLVEFLSDFAGATWRQCQSAKAARADKAPVSSKQKDSVLQFRSGEDEGGGPKPA